MTKNILANPMVLRTDHIIGMLVKIITQRLAGLSTISHCKNVRDIALAIGEKLSLGKRALRQIEIAALLHDIGKIDLPDSILFKPGKLEDYELKLMHHYISYGTKQLTNFFSKDIIAILTFYKENYDGSGYPLSLEDKEIFILPKILGISEAYVSLQEDRLWRKGYSQKKTLKIIEQEKGIKWSPNLVTMLIFAANEIEEVEQCPPIILA